MHLCAGEINRDSALQLPWRKVVVPRASSYSALMVTGNSRVEVFADHVEKYTADPASTARKYAAVHDIARLHGFLAPRVLDVRPDRVLLERMRDMQSLRELYVAGDSAALDAVVARAGEILALLHDNLPKADGIDWSPPPGFLDLAQRYLGRPVDMFALPRATLHGDYSFANVLVTRQPPQSVVIIDPCPNFGSTFDEWTVAPVYIDVGKMLACLEGQIPIRRQHRRRSSARIAELQDKFIHAYEGSGRILDSDIAHAFAYAVASAQFYRRYGRLSAFHRFALYNRFRGNFPLSRKQLGES
jgi:streptomycin 6-kinase